MHGGNHVLSEHFQCFACGGESPNSIIFVLVLTKKSNKRLRSRPQFLLVFFYLNNLGLGHISVSIFLYLDENRTKSLSRSSQQFRIHTSSNNGMATNIILYPITFNKNRQSKQNRLLPYVLKIGIGFARNSEHPTATLSRIKFMWHCMRGLTENYFINGCHGSTLFEGRVLNDYRN